MKDEPNIKKKQSLQFSFNSQNPRGKELPRKQMYEDPSKEQLKDLLKFVWTKNREPVNKISKYIEYLTNGNNLSL